MTGSRRRFTVSVPDWGQDHLSSDAIVAFVDNELAHGPFTRATQHIAVCPECAAQVRAQGQASTALRTAGGPCLPTSLMSALRSIPRDTELPAPPAGLAMTADGQLVDVLRPESMLTPAVAPKPAAGQDATQNLGQNLGQGPGQRSAQMQRRIKIGATAAVSGLALGAVAFGVAALASGAPQPGAQPDRGVLGGPVVGGLDAHLRASFSPNPPGSP